MKNVLKKKVKKREDKEKLNQKLKTFQEVYKMRFDSIDLKNYIDKYGRMNDKGIKNIDLGKGYEIQYKKPNVF